VFRKISRVAEEARRVTHGSNDSRVPQTIKINLVQKSRFSVSCVLENHVNKFLVDTGSQACLIDKHVFMHLENRPPLRSCSLSLSTADGSDRHVSGKIDVEFRIGDILFCHEFIVTELGKLSGILGMDFLQSNDVTLHLS
jgi:predicted aspartyl protease